MNLIELGSDFQEAREHAERLAADMGAHRVPSYHKDLLRGVSTYWWEFFKAVPTLDVVYVPIGQGSGACSAIAAKLALGHPARIVGVVSAHATTYADSIAAGRVVEAPVTTELADGMACRVADTHNVAEGAGAASFAAAWQERERLKGRVVGTTLCGGNVDSDVLVQVLRG